MPKLRKNTNPDSPEQESRPDIMLDKPRLQLPHSNRAFEIFFYSLLVLLGGFGALCCFSTAFQLPLYPVPLLITGTLYAVLGVLQSLLPRGRALVFAAGTLVWGFSILYFFDTAVEGAGRVLNLILRAYSEKLQFPLRQFSVPEAEPEMVLYTCTVFAALLLPPFFQVLAWILVHRKNALGAFSLTGVVLSLSLALSIIPEFWSLCLLLLFWCLLLLSATVLGRRHRLLDEQNRFLVSGAAIRPVLLVLLPVTALCMLGLYRLFPWDTYARPHFVNDLRSGMVNGFGLEAVLQGGQGSNNNRVSLDNLKERGYSGKTALRVKYDWEDGGAGLGENQQKDYLKSFVGSVYTGQSWEKLSQEDARALKEFAGPGQIQNMPFAFAQHLPIRSNKGDLHYTLSVESVSTNPRCIFAPYGLAMGDGLSGMGAEYDGDGFLRSSNLFSGTRSYAVNAITMPAAGESYGARLYQHWKERMIEQLDMSYQEAYFADETRRAAIEEDVSFRETQLLYELTGDGNTELLLFDARNMKAPDWAKAPLTPEGQALVETVERYNEFVYEKYLQLPPACEPFLTEFRMEHGLEAAPEGEGTSEYVYAAFLSQLQEVLSQECSYTLRPPAVPEGQDFVEYFLSESKTGYCVHFATAAVALCRSAGIPARYAEGYAVPSAYNGMWVDVPDKNAHAWLEVYYSGVGWMPVEMTPVSPDAPAAYYNAQAPSNSTEGEGTGEGVSLEVEATATPEPTPSPTPTAAPTASAAPAENTGSQGSGEEEENSVMPLVWGLVGILLLIPAGLWGNRMAHRYGRKKAFSQADRSKAALALYAHLLKLHALEASMYYGERKPPEYWEATALKARFGKDMLSVEELQLLAADAAALESTLKEELPEDRRFYWQYIRGLL